MVQICCVTANTRLQFVPVWLFILFFFSPSSPNMAMHDSCRSLAFLLPAPFRLRPLNCCSRSPCSYCERPSSTHVNQKISAMNVSSPEGICHTWTTVASRFDSDLCTSIRVFPLRSTTNIHLQRRQFYFSIEIVPNGCFVQK